MVEAQKSMSLWINHTKQKYIKWLNHNHSEFHDLSSGEIEGYESYQIILNAWNT